MSILTDTEEMICSVCGKAITLTEVAPGKLRFDNCACSEKPLLWSPERAAFWLAISARVRWEQSAMTSARIVRQPGTGGICFSRGRKPAVTSRPRSA